MSVLVEIKVSLAEEMIRQRHERARHWDVNEDAVVEQALGLLFAQDDPAPLNDYWFSVSTMREEWEAMPEDWREFTHVTGSACSSAGYRVNPCRPNISQTRKSPY